MDHIDTALLDVYNIGLFCQVFIVDFCKITVNDDKISFERWVL